jgi:hypothetical protein
VVPRIDPHTLVAMYFGGSIGWSLYSADLFSVIIDAILPITCTYGLSLSGLVCHSLHFAFEVFIPSITASLHWTWAT